MSAANKSGKHNAAPRAGFAPLETSTTATMVNSGKHNAAPRAGFAPLETSTTATMVNSGKHNAARAGFTCSGAF